MDWAPRTYRPLIACSDDRVMTTTHADTPTSASTADRLDPALLKLAGTVLVGAVAVQLDATIVNVAIDALGRDLHAGLSTIQWVSTGGLSRTDVPSRAIHLRAMLLLPLYYQQARDQSALEAGLLLAPQGLGAMFVPATTAAYRGMCN
jgi:hypothetical protein